MKSMFDFKTVAYAEGASFLALLFVAMPLKYVWGMPLAVKYTGWAHGVLFMAYIALAFRESDRKNWPTITLAKAFIAALLPFGPFWFHRKVEGVPAQ